MMFPETLRSAAIQIPYSRTAAFSELVLRAEAALLRLVSAPEGSRAVLLTGSGTAAMEAAVLNFVDLKGSVAVINGGAFGQRFCDICVRHGVPVQEARVDRDPLTDGSALKKLRAPINALFLNAHETSVGHAYDLQATARFCVEHDCLHVVDGIGLFVTDPLDMTNSHIDVLILSSNKGLALAPGLSMLVLSPKAQARIVAQPRSYYLDLRAMLSDGARGQTPFTPAIGAILQLEERLSGLLKAGPDASIEQARRLATYFRAGIESLPLRPYARHMPNAMTAVEITEPDLPARTIVDRLDAEHGIVVAPNGGQLEAKLFRVAHMGNLTTGDVDLLIKALKQIFQSGIRS
jgi:aspartate aminotransferase-like enzyme